ncbi:MAG: glycosyltransferase family 39 protein [Phycisphaeraceae bacterium]|nr:MAG: glycosyltransferase family 39 protein [Phycisphaeraceae bacterium]
MTGHASPRGRSGPWGHAALIVGVCAAVYWVGLGYAGFSMSEGHRVAPGWEMARGGTWWTTTMFGQAYYRKPPGMAWAVAASAEMFGESEYAARGVSALSATLTALVAWWFGRRWFGAIGGLAAGLASGLTPVLWEPGRSAEIEALHHLGVAAASFAVIDALAGRGRWSAGAMLAAGLLVMVLAKGPAGVPVVAGVVVAGVIVAGARRGVDDRSAGGMRAGLVWIGLGLVAAVGVLGLVAARFLGGGVSDGGAVTQSPGEFLWDRGRLWGVAWLIPGALAMGLPWTVAPAWALWAWRRGDARVSIEAKMLSLGFALGVVVYTALGVSNTRYVMPAVVLCAPVAGWIVAAVLTPGVGVAGAGRWLRLGALVMLAGAAGHHVWQESLRGGTGGRGSGKPAGVQMAEALSAAGYTGRVVVVADGLVEARPEVLLYARRRGAELGLEIVPRWVPGLSARGVPALEGEGAVVLALRTDAGSDEWSRLVGEDADSSVGVGVISRGRAGSYTFTLVPQTTHFNIRPTPGD